ASRLEFHRNEMEGGEARLWRALAPKMKTGSDFARAQLLIANVGRFKIVPNQDVQNYVRGIGERLIPEYQKSLPEGDSQKIPFRFFVVQNKVPNAFALANGTVVVNSGVFEVIENESQLAAVLGHEIAHAVQEHTWRGLEHHKNI